MTEHFNRLTPAEAERLAYLIEELAEAQQAACKILRHGYASHNPDAVSKHDNREDLRRELLDVTGAISRMVEARDISDDVFLHASPTKGARYMHHQNGR